MNALLPEMSLATVSNGHGMAAPVVVAVPEENSKDALSVAVQGLFNDSAASSATSSAPAAVPPSSLVTVSPNHRRILNMYCRICGSRTVGNSGRWISILNFKIVLRRLHDVDVEGESAEMYPRGVCGTCSEKYKFDRREDSLYRKVRDKRNRITSTAFTAFGAKGPKGTVPTDVFKNSFFRYSPLYLVFRSKSALNLATAIPSSAWPANTRCTIFGLTRVTSARSAATSWISKSPRPSRRWSGRWRG